ncbi:prepilin peptidase [Bradyrhizobium sp. STM 3562]|uniref:prepilin peptidase n=1 Tax=Bradyrhizobium sp. STM 3562 TaxID=578924 RepID=UPI003890C052
MATNSEAPWFFGLYLLLSVLCGAIALIDLRRGIIPNGLNFLIAGLGLAQAVAAGSPADGIETIGEGIAAGAIFWLLRRLYFLWRKTDGLGLGDVKFLAAAAMWVGIAGIPTLLVIAALTALAAAGGLQLAGQQMTRQTSLPFGPFLVAGLLLTLVAQRWIGIG